MGRVIRGIMRLLVGGFVASNASAATITLLPASDVVPDAILVSGAIELGDERRFVDLAIPLESAVVVFASQGGSTFAALEIGKAIRLKSFVTLVQNEEECASACALMWLAGVVRFMGEGARIGFHASYELTDQGAVERGAVNAVVGGYLTLLGYSPSQIARFTEAPPDAMAWFSPAQFREIGVDIQVLDSETASAPPGPQPSTSSPSASPPDSPPEIPRGEPLQLFAIKGWTSAAIKSGNSSYPAFVVRLVDANDKLSGHIFVGCPPPQIGPYLEFAVSDLLNWPNTTSTHAWINGGSFEASVSEGSIFVLIEGRNHARMETLSNELLRPGPATLSLGKEATPDLVVTFYDWTSDYARRYEQASNQRFTPMRSFADACSDAVSADTPPPQYRTLPNGSTVRIR